MCPKSTKKRAGPLWFITQKNNKRMQEIHITFKQWWISQKFDITNLGNQAKETQEQLGRNARKPVFGISHKVKFSSVCSATETGLKIESSLVPSLDIILHNKHEHEKQQRRRSDCADAQSGLCLCCSQTLEERFSSAAEHLLYMYTCTNVYYM